MCGIGIESGSGSQAQPPYCYINSVSCCSTQLTHNSVSVFLDPILGPVTPAGPVGPAGPGAPSTPAGPSPNSQSEYLFFV